MNVLSKSEIENEVRRLGEIQPWWHDIELPHGIHTIGRAPTELAANHNMEKWGRIKNLLDAKGQTVLDLGCNEGFYCHELLALGADRVIGVDINPHRIEKARFVAEAKGLKNATFLERSVYQLNPSEFGGTVDVAIALGLLHRVPDPYGLLSKLAELADIVILEWAALNTEEPMMKFWGGGYKEYDTDNTGYWRVSRRCAKEILFREGFHYFSDIEPTDSRAILAASRIPSPSSTIRSHWENWDESVPKVTKKKQAIPKPRGIRRLFSRA